MVQAIFEVWAVMLDFAVYRYRNFRFGEHDDYFDNAFAFFGQWRIQANFNAGIANVDNVAVNFNRSLSDSVDADMSF